ncbi:MAG: NAD kinase [Propionibacteriaceae bacterium]|nr:NAD kinase [Propionibacteriaceae bacterium]
MEPSRRIAVMMHRGREAATRAAAEFVTEISIKGFRCALDAADSQSLTAEVPDAKIEPLENDVHAELAVVFGGDGNILRAAEWALPRQVPVLGVNLGHVGFLAELESAQLGTLIERVVERDYQVEERQTITCELRDAPGGEKVWESFAVNECAVEKLTRERMLEVLVRIDDRPLSRWATDGVLVATPTGSTAYAFSAHGPVIWPEVEALLLVPLSAHALFNRSVVVGTKSVIKVEVLPSTPDGLIWCDGRRSSEIHAGMELVVAASKEKLLLARTSEQPFITRLVRKFHLPIDGWRGAAEREQVHAE